MDADLDRYMHLGALNRGILMTPFHAMALMSPATTREDVDLHTVMLSVQKAGAGFGTVTGAAGAISCGATCNASLPYGTAVTLTAAADVGSTFAGWSGDLSYRTGPALEDTRDYDHPIIHAYRLSLYRRFEDTYEDPRMDRAFGRILDEVERFSRQRFVARPPFTSPPR